MKYFLGHLVCACSLAATACGDGPPSKSVESLVPSNCPTFVPASKGLPEKGEWKSFPAVGDVNEDGLVDFSVLPRKENGPRVFLSDGVGGWTDASEDLRYPAEISCGIGTRLRDIDGDGHLDLLVADHCQGLYVFHGDGKGHWAPASQGIPRNVQGFNDADAGDLDGDGLVDIVALSAFSSGFLVLKGQADGTWVVRPDTGLPASGFGIAVRLEDVNGDRRLDVVTTFQPSAGERRTIPPPPAKVWLQEDTGNFRPATGFPTRGRFFGLTIWKRPDRAIPDLIFAISGARGGLWRFESANGLDWAEVGRVDRAGFPTEGALFVGIRAVDVDGDGCDDLVTSEGSSGKARIAMGDCKGDWQFCPESTLFSERPLPTWGVETADFNGDGRRDIVAAFGRGSLGAVKVWYQKGTPASNPTR